MERVKVDCELGAPVLYLLPFLHALAHSPRWPIHRVVHRRAARRAISMQMRVEWKKKKRVKEMTGPVRSHQSRVPSDVKNRVSRASFLFTMPYSIFSNYIYTHSYLIAFNIARFSSLNTNKHPVYFECEKCAWNNQRDRILGRSWFYYFSITFVVRHKIHIFICSYI